MVEKGLSPFWSDGVYGSPCRLSFSGVVRESHPTWSVLMAGLFDFEHGLVILVQNVNAAQSILCG